MVPSLKIIGEGRKQPRACLKLVWRLLASRATNCRAGKEIASRFHPAPSGATRDCLWTPAGKRTANIPLAAPTGVQNRKGFPELKVFIVTFDALRADYLSCYNPGTGARHENFEKLAERSYFCANMYANSNQTVTSYTSLITGKLATDVNMSVMAKLDDEVATMPGFLKPFKSYSFVTTGGVGQHNNLCKDFDTYELITTGKNRRVLRSTGRLAYALKMAGISPTSNSPRILKAMLTSLDGTSDQLFLFNFYDTHGPYFPPVSAWKKNVSARSCWKAFNFNRDHFNNIIWSKYMDAASTEAVRGLYRGEVARTDKVLGSFMDALERRGLFDGSLIVVTADHGEMLGERNFLGHWHYLDDPLVKVPLIIKLPGQTKGVRVEQNVQAIDILPTVLQALGVDYDESYLHGNSVCGEIDPERPIFIEQPDNPDEIYRQYSPDKYARYKESRSELSFRVFQVVQGHYKYRLYSNGEHEFLSDDTGPSPLTEEKERELDGLLRGKYEKHLYPAGTDASGEDESEQISNLLRDLGYL